MTSTSTDTRVESLEAEARYRRERLALYRAKLYAGSVASPARLEELERAINRLAAHARINA